MAKSIPEKGQQEVSEATQGDNIVTPIDGFRNRPGEGQAPSNRPGKEAVIVNADLPPLVEPGEYQLVFIRHRTAVLFGNAPKIALRFRILDFGPHKDKELERWFNAKRLIGKAGNGGRFQVGARSDFVHEYLSLFKDQVKRLDRISMRPFRHCVIKGRVETVTTDSKQRKLPELLRYSTIRELLEIGV